MKDDPLTIFVDRLASGKVLVLEEMVSSDFLDVGSADLLFEEEVFIKGECYLTNDALVLHVDIAAQARIPCSICNESVAVDIPIRGFYHLEPLKKITKGFFNMREIVRESVLLETPKFVECNNGNCPKRKTIAKYMKPSPLKGNSTPDDEGYHPFKDL